jgi:hypothetical protein
MGLSFGHEIRQGWARLKPPALDTLDLPQPTHPAGGFMSKCIQLFEFARSVFDNEVQARKVAVVLQAILEAQSPRISEIARAMRGNAEANYKAVQRLLAQLDPQEALIRLFQVQAPFVIGDPTEIPRPQARKTAYVGTLKDGKTKGFWLLVLATPFRGRALPFSFITYSSKTIQQQLDSRNLNHFRAFAHVKALLGEKALVLDREFSYLELMTNLVEEGVHFVIRLNLGSHPPAFYDDEGQRVHLAISPGQTQIYQRLWYKGQIQVNVIGRWKQGLDEPLWVMTDLVAERGLDIYLARMKIEESFRDLKHLLRLDSVMNKRQVLMEKMVALVMLAYAIGVLIGEEVRDQVYGLPIQQDEQVTDEERIPGQPQMKQGKKWKLYSGLFLLLKQKLPLSAARWRQLVQRVAACFATLVQYPVRSYV